MAASRDTQLPDERSVLEPLVPPGLELDEFASIAYVSVVGFFFLRTRLLGIAFPCHCNFEEVNLRFYVRHRSAEGWRRGVAFVREIVPRQAIATLARRLYGEPYSAFPMTHSITCKANEIHCRYDWRREGRREFVSASAEGEAQAIGAGSLEEFITEHYWVTRRGAEAAPSTRSNIRPGASGRRVRPTSRPTWPLFTVRSS